MALLNIEIDGRQTQVESGRTVMDAAKQLGIKIPHFCYHRKLSIAANCRMCLVQVEKAPKPLPACATPVTEGMKVQTHSPFAVQAQKSVMEFLLINHPLDCPICDQGGECKLQDVSMGYGGGASRYQEPKRVVANKDLGSLIATDMTRCILCTRCVRYGQEIAGIMELGVGGRGEHSEILAFMGTTVDSEVSGNAIDLCPVGALTSKPFRFVARSWELSRVPSISPHDALGTQVEVQVKLGKDVVRVLPRKNDDINECWLADRDRFSYQALHSEDRLLHPQVKRDGRWVSVSWAEALQTAVDGLLSVQRTVGGDGIGAWLSPHQTLEELFLAQKLLRELGCHNIDHRTRQVDFALDPLQRGISWLGTPISYWSSLKSILLIGSSLRQDQPLLAVRLRRSARSGARIHRVMARSEDWAMPVAETLLGKPSDWPALLGDILSAVAQRSGKVVPQDLQPLLNSPSMQADAVAKDLLSNPGQAVVILGQQAQQHPAYATLYRIAQVLAEMVEQPLGQLPQAANSVGASLAGALPHRGPFYIHEPSGLDFMAQCRQPRRAYVVMGIEPELDCADPALACEVLQQAETVVAMTAFKGNAEKWATVMLPIAPFTETGGTFVSMEGRVQSFTGVVLPRGEARPGWKVWRVLGNLMNCSGFEQDTLDAVRAEISSDIDEMAREALDNGLSGEPAIRVHASLGTLERLGGVPGYHADPLVRRSSALQQTALGQDIAVVLNTQQAEHMGLTAGQAVRIWQGKHDTVLPLKLDDGLAMGCAVVPAGVPSTAMLGDAMGWIHLEGV
ncbi:MAG: NADH-quinone oxidoreductase subunit NuoG [Betaproteobacteria bacterium]|nr:NADH-quinone oxidoreductase subunit NuoG [Betaproteobacteria bacterium]